MKRCAALSQICGSAARFFMRIMPGRWRKCMLRGAISHIKLVCISHVTVFLYGHIDGVFKVWYNDIGGVKSPHRLDIYEKEVAPLAGFNVASEDDAHAAVMALPV